MNYQELFDSHRKTPAFARKDVLAKLIKICDSTGITILHAPPQIGKTRVLVELIDRVNRQNKDCVTNKGNNPRILWGYVACAEDTDDALRRATAQLYENWRNSRSFVEELKELKIKFEKTNLSDLSAFIREAFGPAVGITTVINLIIKKLEAQASEKGFNQLNKLSYDAVRDTWKLLGYVKNVKQLIIIDAFEQLNTGEQNRLISQIRRFLSEQPELPSVQLVLSTRSPANEKEVGEVAAWEKIETLNAPEPILTKISLDPLYFSSDDENELNRLKKHLIEHIPIISDDNVGDAVNIMQGHPGIIWRWKLAEVEDWKSLESHVADSTHETWQELINIIERLDEDDQTALKAVITLSLLPEQTNKPAWNTLAPILKPLVDERMLRKLKREKVLIDMNFPSFGLTQRYQFAGRYLLSNDDFTNESKYVLEELAEILAVNLELISESYYAWQALFNLSHSAHSLGCDENLVYLIESLAYLFNQPDIKEHSGKKLNYKKLLRYSSQLEGKPYRSLILACIVSHTDLLFSEQLYDEILTVCKECFLEYKPDNLNHKNQAQLCHLMLLNAKVLDLLEQKEESLAFYLSVANAFNPYLSQDNIRDQVAYAYFHAGLIQLILDREDSAIETFKKIVSTFGAEDSDARVRGFVAKSQYMLLTPSGPSNQIEEYKVICALFDAHDSSPWVRETVSDSMINVAAQLESLDRPIEAEEWYTRLAHSFKSFDPSEKIRINLSQALLRLGRLAYGQGKEEEALERLSEAEEFLQTNVENAEIRTNVISAMFSKFLILEENKAFNETLEIGESIVSMFDVNDNSIDVLNILAQTIIRSAFILEKTEKYVKAFEKYNFIVSNFDVNHDSEKISECYRVASEKIELLKDRQIELDTSNIQNINKEATKVEISDKTESLIPPRYDQENEDLAAMRVAAVELYEAKEYKAAHEILSLLVRHNATTAGHVALHGLVMAHLGLFDSGMKMLDHAWDASEELSSEDAARVKDFVESSKKEVFDMYLKESKDELKKSDEDEED